MNTLMCSMCNYTTQSQTNFTNHIVRRHQNDSNFHVTCTFPGCFYSSESWCGFKTHFSRKHQQKIDVATVNEHDQMHVDEIPPIILPNKTWTCIVQILH